MKIFWAWQSDTPGRIGRHFVRDALSVAIRELKEELTIEEPERGELHLDHDRKGVPGSPDLARTILDKIEHSVIFVADVTPVGKTEDGKSVINPNVAIELGYALKHLGDQALLMVLNDVYGSRETLPFDLRHKAGPIIYSLRPDSGRDEREKVQRAFASHLKVALRECLTTLPRVSPVPSHEEIPHQSTVAEYFADAEALADDLDGSGRPLVYGESPLLYLRVIPMRSLPLLRNSEIADLVRGINILPLRQTVGDGSSWRRNRYGGITYSFFQGPEGDLISTSTQVFRSREIWGLDESLLRRRKEAIPSIALEEVLEQALKHYLAVGKERLGLDCPLVVEAGAVRVNGFTIAMGEEYLERFWGPIHQDQIQSRQTLESFDEREVNRVLLAIFEDFFDAAGQRRPGGFRGFPAAAVEKT